MTCHVDSQGRTEVGVLPPQPRRPARKRFRNKCFLTPSKVTVLRARLNSGSKSSAKESCTPAGTRFPHP